MNLNYLQPLAYGQIIMISPISNKKAFLYSDGFINKNVSLAQESNNFGTASNYHSLFQVFPTFLNNQKYRALKLLEPSSQFKKIEIDESIDKLVIEYKLNQETCEKLMNTSVSYEAHLQFFHIASNKYLACFYEEAEGEKENFKLVLTDYPSENSHFKILPVYAHQKRRDGIIYLSDTVYIVTAHQFLNKIPYIRIAEETKIRKNRNKLSKKYSHDSNWIDDFQILKRSMRFVPEVRFSDDYVLEKSRSDIFSSNYKQKVEKKRLKKNNLEANVSLENKSLFSIVFFSEENNPEFLYFGNIVWLQYSELNFTLIGLKSESGDKVSLAQSSIGEIGAQSIVNSNGMWILENSNPNIGGIIEWEYPLRIKHYGTGKYLTLTEENKQYNLTLSIHSTDENLFTFSFLPSAISSIKKHLTKDSFLKIRHYNTKLWLQILHTEKLSSTAKVDNNFNAKYHFTDKKIDEVAFKIYKGSFDFIIKPTQVKF